jgi:thiol-disulfide isomerase/thioredoxin
MMSCKSGSASDMETTTGKATLVFRASQNEMTVHIYKPIDDTYNYDYITDKIDIKPNISINYELDVNGFAFVKCRFSNGQWGEYLVFPDDCVEIICEPQGITLSGSNAEGHKYFYDNYIQRGLGYYHDIIRQHIFRYLAVPTTINYDSLYYYFQQELILPYQTDLKKMEMSGSITSKFSSILAQNLYIGCCSALRTTYYNLLNRGNSQLNSEYSYFAPSEGDVRNVLEQLGKMYETVYAMSDDIKKMQYSIAEYYRLKYNYLDDETKEKLTEGYDKDTFGSQAYLLLAPDSLQLRHYASNLISDLQSIRPFYNFDQEKMLAFLNNKFPNSEYVAIIRKLMRQTQSTEAIDEVVVVNDSPSSIEDMMQLPGIKGKYAYIDLWATSCVPCIYEFKYNDEIHQLLAQYNNIVPVYISIDEDRKIWENGVRKFNLKGYHIMASKSLNEDIGIKVYHATKVGYIPRYLLLDPDGNIVNDDLPRPSKSSQLKPILATALK